MVIVRSKTDPVFGALPQEARIWLEILPWTQRRYVLSLCHLISASSPEARAEFLDEYTADGLVHRVLQDQDTKQKVSHYLDQFCIKTPLTVPVLQSYIRQFYVHSAQDSRQQPALYLESALKLMVSSHEKNNVFNYVLGFELIRMMFQMSWDQQERLYHLQVSQEEFIRKYIKPIQFAHRINGIVVPREEGHFFARREYFVVRPHISEKRLIELVMATFTTEAVMEFGFSVIRTPKAFQFDHDYIFCTEPVKAIFN